MTQFLAGGKRGAWFLPEVNDEVLVAFEAGDPERPYVLGSLWNGVDRPPVSDAELSDNNIKRLQTRSGVRITIDDRNGDERIVLSVPDGPKLELSARDGLTLEATSNNRIVISDQGIEITARQISATSSNDMTLSAGKDLGLNAARDVDLHADGDCRVQADRDIALQGHDVTIAETG